MIGADLLSHASLLAHFADQRSHSVRYALDALADNAEQLQSLVGEGAAPLRDAGTTVMGWVNLGRTADAAGDTHALVRAVAMLTAASVAVITLEASRTPMAQRSPAPGGGGWTPRLIQGGRA